MAKKQSSRISRNKLRLLFFFIILFLGYCYLPLIVKIKRLNRLTKEIEKEIANLEEESRTLEQEKALLETDLEYIDRIARESLDLIGEGEILYKIVNKRSRGGAVR